MLSGKKILVTGATGQVARPIAESLAKDNEVWAAARFNDVAAKAELEDQGIRCAFWKLGSDEFAGLPDDFTHVVHAAADYFTPDYDRAIRTNAEGTGLLMAHCRKAEAFLFVSSSAVYLEHEDPWHQYVETDPYGGVAHYAPPYPGGKTATEAVVRTMARHLGLKSTIARLNMAYGTSGHGGVPNVYAVMVQEGKPLPMRRDRLGICSPIHQDDIVGQVPALLDAASTTAVIVNWGGDDPMLDTDLFGYLEELLGKKVEVEYPEVFFDLQILDPTKRQSITGPATVSWRDGVRRSIAANHPDLILAPEVGRS